MLTSPKTCSKCIKNLIIKDMAFRVNTHIHEHEQVGVSNPVINLLQTSVNDCLSYDYKTGEWQYGPSKNPNPPKIVTESKPEHVPVPVQPNIPVNIRDRISKKSMGKLF